LHYNRQSFPTRRSSDLSLEISDKQMIGSSTFRYMSFEKFGQYFRSCKEKFIKVLRDMLFKKGTVSFNLERDIEKIFFTVIIVKIDRKSTRLNSSHVKIS